MIRSDTSIFLGRAPEVMIDPLKSMGIDSIKRVIIRFLVLAIS
jgi:hypothetical protein